MFRNHEQCPCSTIPITRMLLRDGLETFAQLFISMACVVVQTRLVLVCHAVRKVKVFVLIMQPFLYGWYFGNICFKGFQVFRIGPEGQ